MGSRADRRAWQEQELREQEAMANARPNEPVAPIADAEKCPGGRGAHDFTMRGRDGIRRCWYCCQRKPEAPS